MIAFSAIFLGVNSFAAESNGDNSETALPGHWQQGLTADVRSLQQTKSLPYPHVGDILDFAADHTFRLYPKCPRKSDLEKIGANYIGGSWKITSEDTLHILLEAKGKKFERDVKFIIKGDDLTFISPSNPKEQFGKYNGPVPQECPAIGIPKK